MSKFFVKEAGLVTLVIKFDSPEVKKEFDEWTSSSRFSQIYLDVGDEVIRTFRHTDIGRIESWLIEHSVEKVKKPR